MTDGVVSLRPEHDLEEFFNFMWGQTEGYVYAPLKSLQGEWVTKFFFQWPKQKVELIDHVLKNSLDNECYFGPALYKGPGLANKDNVLGSWVLWTEFDGNPPPKGIMGDSIPNPSWRVRSSTELHQHHYWKLEEFETDIEKIETFNKAIAYTLQADTSAWDSTQILRPPATKNHKRDKIVYVLSRTSQTYGYKYFKHLEVPKQLTKQDITLNELPDAVSVIAKYQWDSDDFEFFRKKDIPVGSRSSALTRLAHICAELQMTDEEAYVILEHADTRWEKFTGRRDRIQRLLGLLNYARHKHPLDPEVVVNDFPVYSWQELMDLEIHIDWLIEGILQRQGLMILSGAPGAGKTQISLQLLLHMAAGKPFLRWDLGAPRKVCYFSMEMGPAELKYIMGIMNEVLNDEERELLHRNFMFVPIGHGIMFDTPVDRKRIEKLLAERQPECVVFDSLSVTTMDELSDERTAKRIMDYASIIRLQYDVSIIFIHHNRKGQVNNKKPVSLADVYGSNFITAQATTVATIWRNDKSGEIELRFPKVRLSKEPEMILLTRKEGIQFQELAPTALIRKAEEVKRETVKPDIFNPGGGADLRFR